MDVVAFFFILIIISSPTISPLHLQLMKSEIIIELYKKEYQTPETARMTNHTEEAYDWYIEAYKKVEKLSKSMIINEIAQIQGMGQSLVKECINILNKEED